MRLFAIGLAAAALAVLSPAMASAADQKDDPKAHTQGMAEVPPLLQQSGVNCTPSDAKFLGQGSNKDAATGKTVTEKVYEVACQEGLGYMIMAPQGQPAQAYDCLAMTINKPKPGEKDVGKPYCKLPQNADPITGLAAVATKAGVPCQANQARYMGSSTDGKLDQYEVACADGSAYIVQDPRQGSSTALNNVDCMQLKPGSCQFLSKDQLLARLSAAAAPSKRSCQTTDARWIGTSSTDKSNYFEIACSDPTAGYVLQLDAKYNYMTSIDCARANAVGGGCTLSAAGGQTAELATYARLAKEIGYQCNVSSYRSIGSDTKTGREVVEYACSDHPDGAIAFVPTDKGQTGSYFNCARAASIGQDQKCVLSTAEATNAKIASEITAKGHSCNVTNTRWVGATPDGTEYLEVACTGQPGMMLSYVQQTEQLKGITSCLQAKGIGDGCQLK